MKYDIKLLDEFVVEHDGKGVNASYKKLSLIIAYLLVEGKTDREHLSELFWENYDNKTAKKNLRNAVYNIKKIFGDDFIICHGRSTLEINLDMVNSVDYFNLLKCEGSEFVNSYAVFLKGINLSVSVNIEKWADNINDNLLSKYLEYSGLMINNYIDNKDFNSALEIIRKVLVYNQYNENLYRLAMKIYRSQERYTEAIELYERLSHLLEKEFAIRPEKNTRVLYEEISLIRNSANIVEVDNDYTYDEKIIEKIKDIINENLVFNSSRVAFLHGEAGVGKKEIIDKVINSDIKEKYSIYNIKCSPKEKDFSYNVIYYLVDKINDENLNRILKKLFMFSVETVNEDTLTIGAPIIGIIIEELVEYFNNHRSIIVVSDFCNMDRESMKIFNEIYEKSNVVLLLTSRKDSCLQNSNGTCNLICKSTKPIEVKAWDLNQVKKYVQSKHIKISDSEIEKIYNVSRGNRLLIDTAINSKLNVVSFSQVIDEGILNIDNRARKLLDLISIYNYSVNFEDLLAIYPSSELELVDLLEYLLSVNILDVENNTNGNFYFFRHNLLKEYVYTKIESVKKAQYHYIIASNYEKNKRGDISIQSAAIISYHYNHSNNKFKAIEYSLLYLLLTSSSSLEVFPNITSSVISKKSISDQLKTLEIKIESLVNLNEFEYDYLQLLICLIKLYLKISSCRVTSVEKLLNRAKELCVSSNHEYYLSTVYLLQLFYAQNTNNVEIFRTSLDELKSYKMYSRIEQRMEAYYEFLRGDVDLAICKLEDYLFMKSNEKQKYIDFASYIYLAGFFVSTQNYKRALVNLENAEKEMKHKHINESSKVLLYGYKLICYYHMNDLYNARMLIDVTSNALENSNTVWKKSYIYSYLYIVDSKKNEKFYQKAKYYYRSCLLENELNIINRNLK